MGKKSFIYRPMKLTPKYISFGNNVYVNDFARIEGIDKYNLKSFNPEIVFEDNVSVQQGFHLTCSKKITVGKNTAIAAYVSITDITHPYKDIKIAPEYQDIEVDEVHIGENCKIYNNAVILPGVQLGRHTIVAANSVVVKGVYDDYVVLGGAPAKILKKFNLLTNEWEKIN